MLGLKLRAEFLSAQMPATYPTADERNVLWAISAAQNCPVVLIGERVRGKSHSNRRYCSRGDSSELEVEEVCTSLSPLHPAPVRTSREISAL
jgi:hypothetical protein